MFCAGLWAVSQWWEKALAKPVGAARISPNGCYRVQEFKPFFGYCPASFTPSRPRMNQSSSSGLFAGRFRPFFRLYDNRNGQLIGESAIYDLVNYGGPVSWGFGSHPTVSVEMITIGTDLPDCIGNQPG
nr:hypothetical protein GCM10020185_31700 [Pseudomonas brassicacearum subsp. brassicacearum]